MSQTVIRYIETLRLIPVSPGAISVNEIEKKLRQQNFEFTRRTLERDLIKLMEHFPIKHDGNKDIRGWSWKEEADLYSLKNMDSNVALTFKMVELFLTDSLPPSTQERLKDYFNEADKVLEAHQDEGLIDWPNRIAVISKSLPLIQPKIPKQVFSNIYQSLRLKKQIVVKYRVKHLNIEEEYILNPHALVVVDQVIYLVATKADQPREVHHFGTHRFLSVELKDEFANILPNFNLKAHIEAGHFGYLADKKQKTIIVRISMTPETANHFKETPISNDQSFETDPKTGREILQATVNNTRQLRWWIRSFSHEMIVLYPKALKDELRAEVEHTLKNYNELTKHLD